MNGYYTKNLYGNNGTNAKGRLKIEASNLPEFKELLEKVEEEARQLNETISRLRNFEFNIDFSIAESTSGVIEAASSVTSVIAIKYTQA